MTNFDKMAHEMGFDIEPVRPVETPKSKAFGVLEEYYNNPYMKDRGLPSRIMVWHDGKLHIFNTAKLVEEYMSL